MSQLMPGKRAQYVTTRAAGQMTETVKAIVERIGPGGRIEVMPALDFEDAKKLLAEALKFIHDDARELKERIDAFLEGK